MALSFATILFFAESADTYTWIENAPETLFQDFPRLKNVKEVGSHSSVVIVPRYQELRI